MTLILRPPGRGNWRPLKVTVEGDRAMPLFVRAGSFITIGGRTFRVSKVLP